MLFNCLEKIKKIIMLLDPNLESFAFKSDHVNLLYWIKVQRPYCPVQFLNEAMYKRSYVYIYIYKSPL